MSWRIEGQVAVVTGANRGIGLAITEALLDRGAAKVYAGARDTSQLAGLVTKYGARIVPLRLDVTREEDIRGAATHAPDATLLVNNAGVAAHGFAPFGDASWIEAGRQEYEVNVLGLLRVSQALSPVLARNGGGAIVNLSSVAGLVGMPVFLAYSASKAAVHSLTQSMRIMLRPQGTRVVGVYPGPVDTDMAKPLPLEKVTPRAAADAILDGLEAEAEEIYPDPTARQFGDGWRDDPKGLEAMVAGMSVGA